MVRHVALGGHTFEKPGRLDRMTRDKGKQLAEIFSGLHELVSMITPTAEASRVRPQVPVLGCPAARPPRGPGRAVCERTPGLGVGGLVSAFRREAVLTQALNKARYPKETNVFLLVALGMLLTASPSSMAGRHLQGSHQRPGPVCAV